MFNLTLLATILAILITTSPKILTNGWPTWAGAPGGSKYSPLNQINRRNVTDLKIAWACRTGDFAGDMTRSGKKTGGLKANK